MPGPRHGFYLFGINDLLMGRRVASNAASTSAEDVKFLQSSGTLAWELQIRNPHWNHKFAGVPLIPKFA